MERRAVARVGARKSRRRLKTFLWVAGLGVLVITLIYFEQTAILYLLATLGLTGLLIVVALSDLDGRKARENVSDLGDDAAAIGSGITGTTAATAAVTNAPAANTRRRPTPKRR
ncbi:MAG: hypothetical protein ICV68_06420 [Pyrinomonadaceae bacterium]|nr:hypothetical protein [Pyrinomonadaceae bacterium]